MTGASAVIIMENHEQVVKETAAETVPDGHELVTDGKAQAGDIFFNGYSRASWLDGNGELYVVSQWDYGTDADSFWALARPVEEAA